MRDKELDIIKGLACILMVVAHAGTLGKTIENSFTTLLWYLAFFAPILFFASVGISLIHQLKKRSVMKILVFNIIFLVISFADIGKQSLNYLDITKPNLIASLAIATIFSLIFRKVNGLLILILLLAMDRFANRFLIPPTLIYGLPFALIPWAGITTLGRYLYLNKKSLIYILAIGFLITLYYVLVKHQTISTQFLTSLFLGLSLVIYSSVAISASRISNIPILSSFLTYLGENTLLFYWLHLFILFMISFQLPAPLMWAFVLMITIISIKILKKVNDLTLKKLSYGPWFWVTITLAVFIPLVTPLSQQTQFFFFTALTIIFALNYHQLLQLKLLDHIERFTKL